MLAQGDSDTYKWRAFTAIAISFVTQVMSMSMVFIALPSIAGEFTITLGAVSWVVIVEALTISSLLLPLGRVGDLIGRRRMHLIGLSIFLVGCLAVAAAPSFALLIAARVVMASGNAMSQSVSTAMVISVFPSTERATALGHQTTAVSIGGATGPMLAGLLLQVLPWEALFLVLAVPTLIALVAAVFILDEELVSEPMADERPPFDWGGAGLSALMMVTLVLTINNPFGVPWASPLMLGGVVSVVALLTAFIRWELARDAPMLQLRLFAIPTFTMAAASRLVGFMAATAVRILLPIMLISLRGMGEAATGGVLFFISLGMGIAANASGRLSDRHGGRPFAIAGFVILTISVIGLGLSSPDVTLALLLILVFLQGFGTGLWNVPNNAAIIGSVPSSSYGVVGAFTNLTRTVGNVFGQALTTAIVTAVMVARGFDIPLGELGDSVGAGDAFMAGWRYAFVVVVLLSMTGIVFSMRLPGLPGAGSDPGAESDLAVAGEAGDEQRT